MFTQEAVRYARVINKLLDRIVEKNPGSTQMSVTVDDSLCEHEWETTGVFISGKFQVKCKKCPQIIYVSPKLKKVGESEKSIISKA